MILNVPPCVTRGVGRSREGHETLAASTHGNRNP